MEDRWRNTEEIAEYLGCDPSWVRKHGKKNGMPLHKRGHYITAKFSEIDDWVKNNKA